MGRALIVYTTRTQETRQIADLIAEGIRFSGHEAVVEDVKAIKNEDALAGYDAYVFGSPTYHGEMIQPMKTFFTTWAAPTLIWRNSTTPGLS